MVLNLLDVHVLTIMYEEIAETSMPQLHHLNNKGNFLIQECRRRNIHLIVIFNRALELIEKKLYKTISPAPEVILQAKVKHHLKDLKSKILNNHIIDQIYNNKAIYQSPDKKVKKYAQVFQKTATYFNLPSLPFDTLIKDTLPHSESKKEVNERIKRLPRAKYRIRKPLSRAYSKLDAKLKSTIEINYELEKMKNKYNEVKKRWDIYETIVNEVSKSNKEKTKSNKNVEFYLWRAVKHKLPCNTIYNE